MVSRPLKGATAAARADGLALDLTPLGRAEAVGELAAFPGLDHAPRQLTDGEALHGHRDRPLSRFRLPPPWFPLPRHRSSSPAAGVSARADYVGILGRPSHAITLVTVVSRDLANSRRLVTA